MTMDLPVISKTGAFSPIRPPCPRLGSAYELPRKKWPQNYHKLSKLKDDKLFAHPCIYARICYATTSSLTSQSH